jgi:hypothetical protein
VKLRTAWFGLQLSDTDVLTVGAYVQKYLGYVLQDMFGTTAAQYTGLNVTPGTGLNIRVSTGRLYQQQAAIATQWGSTPTGLAPDSTIITKQGALETALPSLGTFLAPGSGTNYYTVQAICTDQDINPTGRTFTPSPNVETSQVVTTDRVTAIVLSVKGPSTSSPPSPDTGNTVIATIAIPAGALTMLSGYITQTPQYPGTAGILAGGSFVQLSPGGAQTGFMNITGTVTCGSVSAGISGISTIGPISALGLLTANGGINVANAAANLNAGAIVLSPANSFIPMVVNGATGGGQTALLIQANLQPGGTTVFSVDATGAILFANGAAKLTSGSGSTKIIPAATGKPFTVRNAADGQTNLQVPDSGGCNVLPNGATNPSGVLPVYSSSGAVTVNSQRLTSFRFTIAAGSATGTVTLSGDGIIVSPIAMTGNVTDPGSGGPYDTNHFIKSLAYNPGTHTLTVTLDSAAVTNPCPVSGFIYG